MDTKMRCQVLPAAYLCVAFAILILPIQWIFAWLIAAFIHELFHYGAVRICGYTVYRIEIGAAGAKMETLPMDRWKSVFSTLAGPVGSFLLIFIAKYFPRVALCGLFHGVFNLLPVYPLDGGRILKRCLERTRWCNQISATIECLVISLLFGLCLYGAIRLSLGLLPFLVPLSMVIKRKKYLAKNRN